MRPMLLTAVLACAAVLAAACAGAAAQGRGGSGAEPGGAARIYQAKCTSCHRPYERESQNRSEWAKVLARMATRARLTPEQHDRLLPWLQAGAKDAAAPQEKGP